MNKLSFTQKLWLPLVISLTAMGTFQVGAVVRLDAGMCTGISTGISAKVSRTLRI